MKYKRIEPIDIEMIEASLLSSPKQVSAVSCATEKMKRIGFLNQVIHYSDDFDDSDHHEITQLFSGNHDEILA